MNIQTDDISDRIADHNRISIRAVLVREGEDTNAALAKAGLIDAVALPVVIGDEPDSAGGILGDGRTPNVTAILETEQYDEAFESFEQAGPAPPAPKTARSSARVTTTLPPAYGMQPLAPVSRTTWSKIKIPR